MCIKYCFYFLIWISSMSSTTSWRQCDTVSLLSEMQSTCISEGKKLPFDRDWMLTDLVLAYLVRLTFFPRLVCFFFIEKENTEKRGFDVKVK